MDKYSIGPGEDYEVRIAEEIKRAEWFLVVCTGFPRRDADMMWSFFEAGQFRATLKKSLVPEANKRIVCIFDDEPPSILSMFQGVKVCGKQRTGSNIDMSTTLAKDNIQLDDFAIFSLLERMLKNSPETPLRDVNTSSTKEMFREESHKLIKLFELARPQDLIDEKSLQPKISFELAPGGRITPDTLVKGYDKSLRDLFSIETDETTWGRVCGICSTANGGKPAWLSDIEAAAADIMLDNTPANVGNKCILEGKIYRVIVARYEIYKDGRRIIVCGFSTSHQSTIRFNKAKFNSAELFDFKHQISRTAYPHAESAQEGKASITCRSSAKLLSPLGSYRDGGKTVWACC